MLSMGQHSCRLVRVSILTCVHCWNHQQRACEYQNWTTARWRKKPCLNNQKDLLMHNLEESAPISPMGWRQEAVWCFGHCPAGKHCHSCGCYFNMSHLLHLTIIVDQIHPFMTTVFPNSSGFVKQDNPPYHTARIPCWLDLQIPHISIRLSVSGMCWTNRSNP